MGKLLGIFLLIFGLAIIYLDSSGDLGSFGTRYSVIFGIVFAIIGLGMIIFSKSRAP